MNNELESFKLYYSNLLVFTIQMSVKINATIVYRVLLKITWKSRSMSMKKK